MADAITVSSFNNTLKVVGLFDTIREQYAIKSFLLTNLVDRTPQVDLAGRTFEIPLETRGSASYRAMLELELVAEPDSPAHLIANPTVKQCSATFRISEKLQASSTSNRAAWVEGRVHAMMNTIRMFGQHKNRELYGWGAAALARVETFVAATKVLTLYGDQETGGGNTFGEKYMINSLRLTNHTGAPTGTAVNGTSNMSVTARTTSATAPTITVSGTLGDLANDDYLIQGSNERPSMGRAVVGLMGAIDDGTILDTYMALSRGTYAFWKAKVTGSIGAANLEHTFVKQADDLAADAGGTTDLILTTYGVRRKLFQQLVGDRQFVTAGKDSGGRWRGGFKMLAIQGPENDNMMVVVDRDCPAGVAFGIDFSTFYMGNLIPAGWFPVDMTGGQIFSQVPGTLAWDAIYRAYHELICVQPNHNWRLDGITEAN